MVSQFQVLLSEKKTAQRSLCKVHKVQTFTDINRMKYILARDPIMCAFMIWLAAEIVFNIIVGVFWARDTDCVRSNFDFQVTSIVKKI